MLKNNLLTALRNILRNKTYTSINILGLSIGLATFILIVLYVKFEFSYDKYHANADNIYRVAAEFEGHNHAGNNKVATVSCPLAPVLKEEFPEVLSAARIKVSRDIKIMVGEQSFFEEVIYFADKSIFQVFTLPLSKGDKNNILIEPFTVIISERIANKYFNNSEPIGQTIRYLNEFDFKVSAIMKDMPLNSHFVMDIVFPLEVLPKITEYDLNNWQRSQAYTYITLETDSDISNFNHKINELYINHNPPQDHGGHSHKKNLFIQSLTSIHLYSQLSSEIHPNNNINNIYLFLSIALLILLIASLNYMNLTTANSLKRNKEVGIRKTVGARKKELIKQFLSESLVFSFLALLIALGIIELILPTFNSFFDRDLLLLSTGEIDFLLWMVGITASVGFFSGIYPAFVLSSLKPMQTFNIDRITRHRKVQLRSIFVVLQFAISIVLIICTFIISGQIEYIQSADVGFQKDQIVTIPVRGKEMSDNLEIIKAELLNYSGVQSVSSSTYLPNRISDQTRFRWIGKSADTEIRCYTSGIDYNYVDLFGITIVEGRNFSLEHSSDANGAFLLNEKAVKALEWEDPLMYELQHWTGETGKVVGIVKDFNYHSLHRNIDPLYLFLDPDNRNYYISVKITGDRIKETMNHIEKTVSLFLNKYPFEFTFFDDVFNDAYREEIRMGKLLNVCAMLAIFISCMGLFGLALYTIERRRKEISIRKVFGSSVSQIVVLLSNEFTRWVILANLISWPIAYFIMNNWLQNFAFKTPISIWYFVVAGILSIFIAMATVSYQTIKTAISNPVETLKYE